MYEIKIFLDSFHDLNYHILETTLLIQLKYCYLYKTNFLNTFRLMLK